MIFWRKPSIESSQPRISYDHHRIIVEKNDQTEILSAAEFEKRFKIVYLPHIQFLQSNDLSSIRRKILLFRSKGLIDQKQLWLGTYFQKEIQTPSVPDVRLRWIDEKIGWGVFAQKDLMPMNYIGEYAGMVRRKKRADSKNGYCFQYSYISGESTRYTIDAQDHGGVVRFINHSSTPNLMSALATHDNLSHIVIFVSRAIKKGEQLCYDYGPDYWKKRTSPKNLNCSSLP